MANDTGQNYENHRTNDMQLIGAALGLIIAVIVALVGAYTSIFVVAVAVAIAGVSTIVLGLRVRAYATRLQDRIIRLEMRLRLRDVLPDELQARIPELTLRQLIGLRFASDAELPELTRKVLDEHIEKAEDIKKQVKDWQADTLRV